MRGRLVPILCAAIVLGLAGVVASKRAQGSPSAGSEVAGARYRLDAHEGDQQLSFSVRAAGLRFDPSVAESDRRAVLGAIAAARRQARTLIELVDGLVDVRVGAVEGRAIGLTESSATGYVVTLDLATVSRRFGERGIERLVLHELGHVVDHALVPDTTVNLLDHEIPTGLGCDQGTMGACAVREERFAETFAKWALGDIGVNLDIGYKVPPPSIGLEAWGAPLATLAARATTR